MDNRGYSQGLTYGSREILKTTAPNSQKMEDGRTALKIKARTSRMPAPGKMD